MAGAEQLLEFLRTVNRGQGLKEVAEAVVRYAISQVPGAQAGALLLLNADFEMFEFQAAVGCDLAELAQIKIPKDLISKRTLFQDQPVILPHLGKLDRELPACGPVQALLTFPIREDSEVIGYLSLVNREDPNAFSPQDLERLKRAWTEITLAIRRARKWEHLVQAERLFRLLFERQADAVYITAFDGTILAANPAAARQTGYSQAELIGLNIMQDIAAEEPVITYEKANERLARGETVMFEEKKRRKDGTLYWTECSVVQFEYKGRPATLSVNRDITARKRLEGELKRRVKELNALNRAARQVSSSLELKQVLKRLAALTGEIVRSAHTSIILLTEDGKIEESFDDAKGIPPLPRRMRPQGMTQRIIATGEPVVVSEVFEDGTTEPPIPSLEDPAQPIPANPVLVEAGIKSLAGVPIMAEGRVMGILSVYSRVPHAFDDQLPILNALASHAAVAMQNAHLYETAQRENARRKRLAKRLQAVEEASRRMKLAESREELYNVVLDSIHRILGYQACAILEPKGEALQVVIERGYSPEARGLRIPFSGEQGITAVAFTSGEPVYVPDVTKDPRYVPGIPGAKCELAIPVTTEERKFGVLNVEHHQVDGIPPDDCDLLEIIASELAVGLLSLERLNGVQSLTKKLAGLHQAVGRLQQCITEEEVLQTVVQVAQDILGFEICAIDLAEGDVLVPKAASGIAMGLAQPSRKGESLAGKTWEEGRTFWGNLRDFPEARPVHPSFQSVISVPIGDFGVFQVVATEPDAFDERDVQLAEILAGHLREEIQRVRLEEKLREQAIRDSLTGLYNRRYLSEVLERERVRAGRYGHPFAVMIMDLDNFKLINDRYGHLKGDEILKGVAELIRKTVRESDLVFRYGGDEFTVVLPETDGQARKVAARLRRAVARWAKRQGLDAFRLGLSIGVATWQPGSFVSAEDLLKEADRGLYRAKRRKKKKS